jgi:hypothetical protein
MILQPPPAEFSAFDLSNWRWAEPFMWIAAFSALIIGLLLFVSAVNKKNMSHGIWATAMFGVWIVFHQVNNDGSYLKLVEPSMAGMLDPFFLIFSTMIPGLIAAGLLYAAYDDKKLGNIFLIFLLVMIPILIVFKVDPTNGKFEDMDLLESLAVMLVHIPSGLILLIIPIMKSKDGNALLFSIGGVLFGLVGIILAVLGFLPAADFPDLYVELGLVDILFAIVPILITASILCFAFGILLTREWTFNIPGIEFEERSAPTA